MNHPSTGEPRLAADLVARLRPEAGRLAHVILVATKPDIIKQYPLYGELSRRGHK